MMGTPLCTERRQKAFAEDLGVTPSHMSFVVSAVAGASVRVNVIGGKVVFCLRLDGSLALFYLFVPCLTLHSMLRLGVDLLT